MFRYKKLDKKKQKISSEKKLGLIENFKFEILDFNN